MIGIVNGNSGTDTVPTITENVAVSEGIGWNNIPSTSTTT